MAPRPVRRKSTEEAGAPAERMDHRELTPKQQKLYGTLALVLALLIMALLGALVGRPLLRFASEPEKFRAWVDSNGLWGRFAYIGMVIVQVVIALIPGEPFEIAAGYAFGAFEGTVLCLIASTLGSMLVFALVRRFGMRLVQIFFSEEKLQSLRFLHASPKRDFLYLLIFMIPGTPKDLLCYFAGLTDVRFPVWLIICSLGRLPAIITSTVGGSALSTSCSSTIPSAGGTTSAGPRPRRKRRSDPGLPCGERTMAHCVLRCAVLLHPHGGRYRPPRPDPPRE